MMYFFGEAISEMVHNPWPTVILIAVVTSAIVGHAIFELVSGKYKTQGAKEVSKERKSYDELAAILTEASEQWHGKTIQHVKSGGLYDIVGVHFRESDMAVCIEYCPAEYREIVGTYVTSMINISKVKFARSVEEMGFGTRFIVLEDSERRFRFLGSSPG